MRQGRRRAGPAADLMLHVCVRGGRASDVRLPAVVRLAALPCARCRALAIAAAALALALALTSFVIAAAAGHLSRADSI